MIPPSHPLLLPALLLLTSTVACQSTPPSETIETSYVVQQTSTTANSQTSSQSSYSESSSGAATSNQQITIHLNAADLDQPHQLSIQTTGTELTGEIYLNGEPIQSLRSTQASIDLSSYLSAGQHTIEITGTYKPMNATVTLEFSAPGTKVTQRSSGSGVLQRTITLTITNPTR